MHRFAMRTSRCGNMQRQRHLIQRLFQVLSGNCSHDRCTFIADDFGMIPAHDAVQTPAAVRRTKIGMRKGGAYDSFGFWRFTHAVIQLVVPSFRPSPVPDADNDCESSLRARIAIVSQAGRDKRERSGFPSCFRTRGRVHFLLRFIRVDNRPSVRSERMCRPIRRESCLILILSSI